MPPNANIWSIIIEKIIHVENLPTNIAEIRERIEFYVKHVLEIYLLTQQIHKKLSSNGGHFDT